MGQPACRGNGGRLRAGPRALSARRIDRRTDDLLWWIRSAYVFGPTPVPDAIERVRALQGEAGDSMALQAGAATTLGRLLAMQGDFEQARELFVFGQDFYRSAGMAVSAAGVTLHGAWIEHHTGDSVGHGGASSGRASTSCRPSVTGRSSPRSLHVSLSSCTRRAASTKPASMSRLLARRALRTISSTSYSRTPSTAACWPTTGRHEEAEVLLRRAVERVETTDFFFARADVLASHAEALLVREPRAAARAAAFALALLTRRATSLAPLASRAPRRARHRARLIDVAGAANVT